jgi:hypothetical protein
MATHINSVATSGLPLVTSAVFYSLMQPGDLIFCWGSGGISKGIEDFTSGPSHILKVWLANDSWPWSTCESEITNGVRWGKFADYMSYPGDIVLCRRPLTIAQIEAEIEFSQTLLDDKYDSIEFASLVARRLSDKFPIIQPKNELYCSGLQQAIAAVSVPFAVPDKPWATPEQLFTEASVTTICGLLQHSPTTRGAI